MKIATASFIEDVNKLKGKVLNFNENPKDDSKRFSLNSKVKLKFLVK
jgi:hypothetical protein